MRFTVTNAAGRVVRTFTGPTTRGVLHRVAWDLRWPPIAGGFGFGGGEEGGPPSGAGGMTRGGGAARRPALPIPVHDIGARGFHAAPGTYTVTMEAGAVKVTQRFEVRGDPASDVTIAEHRAREAFLLEVLEVQAQLTAKGMRREVAPLSRLLGAFTGSGVRQATMHGPTATHRAVLAEARRALGGGAR